LAGGHWKRGVGDQTDPENATVHHRELIGFLIVSELISFQCPFDYLLNIIFNQKLHFADFNRLFNSLKRDLTATTFQLVDTCQNL
jgi:hypothetical protein